MGKFSIYQDIANRTNGDIYIGVVGPVRTGKSTFIKKFMELAVLPNIEDENDQVRTKDELPQSGEGRTIMTTEPKFVPNQAVAVKPDENINFNVRLVDCVGYKVDGALGYQEEDGPRLVTTPWYEEAIPFQEAAEKGTEKVIKDHSTIGLVVTTDGSITDLERENYIEAEKRVINELNDLDKPYIILLNSTHPKQEETKELAEDLEKKYGKRVVPVNCQRLNKENIYDILSEILYEFPLREFAIDLPLWVDELEKNHWLNEDLRELIVQSIKDVYKLRDIKNICQLFNEFDYAEKIDLNLKPGQGLAELIFNLKDGLFYDIVEEVTDLQIDGQHHLFNLIKELSVVKKKYDKVSEALEQASEQGYGIVTPELEDLEFKEPTKISRGGHFGVKLKATAPSIHLIRADVSTEVSPVVGTERQCEELIELFENEFDEDPAAVWDSDFLGRSLHELVKDGINNKLYRMPVNARDKLKDTLQKIINEGSGGLICIIL